MSTASSGQRLTTTDALTYLKTVKEIFQDKRDKYNEFLEVMKDFKALRINTSGVILKVKELFKGNRDLILGFNSFLPKGYEITLPPEGDFVQKKKPVEFQEAMNFVNKIKERFQGDDHLYKSFLDILNMYKKDCKSITDVYHEVSVLFEDHYDLLVEFTHFLPDVSGATSRNFPHPGRNSQLGDDRSYLMTPVKPLHLEKDVNFSEKERLNNVLNPRENRQERKSEWELIDSSEHKRSSVQPNDPCYQGMLDPESAFHEKVKEGLHDSENYEKILDCIRSYRSKICSAAQFRKLVGSLIGKHPNLMVACEDFITYIEKTGGVGQNRLAFRSPKANVDDGDHEREDTYENSDQDKKEKERHGNGVSFTIKDIHGQKLPSYGGRDKFIMKSIQDLDLSNCESCTPSYRLLPDNYPIPSASHRTEVGDEVLNDRWVSVTSGSEDYSFKHMRKNQYEESLFRCEDDRFELDMLLESVNATAKCVEELVDQMNDPNKMLNDPFFIEEHLTALNIRCIERLYGDHGLDVIDVLRKNAPLALPVILIRLKQKQEEWARCRADFNKVWGEIYSRNYHKSLDHRSFYFKQQDTKNLSAKVLLADIKEMSDKNQSEEEMMLFMGAGFKQPIRSQMEFEYSDSDIQEDLYQVINYACGEVCTPEQRERVMIIWRLFLEPVLGLPMRPHCGEDKDVADTAKNHSPVDEIASSKTLHVFENGADHVEKELDYSCGIKNAHYNDNSTDVNASLEADTVHGNSDLTSNPNQNGDSKIVPTEFRHRGSAAIFAEGAENTAVEEGMVPDASHMLTGPESSAKVDEVQNEAMLPRIMEDSNTSILNSSSLSMLPEEVTVNEHHEETEHCSKHEKEGCRSSPDKKVEVRSFTEVENTCIKVDQTPSEGARNSGGTGMEETDVPDDDVEESVHGSTESENASENADISASESANGEGCSPNDPADEAEHDENDNKAESEAETDSINDVHETAAVSSGHILQTVKPLVLDVRRVLRCADKKAWVFYGNDSFYLLFRLHQMLYERMQSAKSHSSSHEHKWKFSSDAHPADAYARFKDTLHNLLNGSSDGAKFEDDCRAIMGAQSYILFTLDKLIYKLIKQMQTIATEETDMKLLQLYKYETSRSSATFSDAVYHENARFLIPDDNLYRIEYLPSVKRMTVQLMKNDLDKIEPPAVCMDPGFVSYLNNEVLSVVPNRKEKPGIYLKRLKRKRCPGDESSAALNYMDGFVLVNGLEMKFNCNKKKASFVLDTTDILHRVGKRKRLCLQMAPSVQPTDSKESSHHGCTSTPNWSC